MSSIAHEQAALSVILQDGWIKTADWHAEIDSTNLRARAQLEQASPEPKVLPALIVADRQTAGRGRGANAWWSPDGCLMLTVTQSVSLARQVNGEQSQLALVCGVAAAQTISQYVDRQLQVELKWPNDVFINGRKCCGILIESGPHSTWLIGIGLNVSMDFEEAPEEVSRKAVSIKQICSGNQPSKPEVLVELMGQLARWVTSWESGSEDWLAAWRDHCLLTGKVVRVRAADGVVVVGRCEGIDARGQLLIRGEMGVAKLNSGEILDWQ